MEWEECRKRTQQHLLNSRQNDIFAKACTDLKAKKLSVLLGGDRQRSEILSSSSSSWVGGPAMYTDPVRSYAAASFLTLDTLHH